MNYIKLEPAGKDRWTYRGLLIVRVKSHGFGTYYQLYQNEEGGLLGDGKTLQEIKGKIADALKLVGSMTEGPL